MSAERYYEVAKAALEIQQKRIEIQRLLRQVAEGLSAKELSSREFDLEYCKELEEYLEIDEDFIFKPSASHGCGTADYKDVWLSVYVDYNHKHRSSVKLFQEILKGISTSEVLSACK